ncbi:MAG: hypothetical protein ACSW8D_16970, partial [Prevotella sp.]
MIVGGVMRVMGVLGNFMGVKGVKEVKGVKDVSFAAPFPYPSRKQQGKRLSSLTPLTSLTPL